MDMFLSIKAQLDNVAKFVADRQKADDEIVATLKIALSEIMMLNADEHGNHAKLAKAIARNALEETTQ